MSSFIFQLHVRKYRMSHFSFGSAVRAFSRRPDSRCYPRGRLDGRPARFAHRGRGVDGSLGK
jgi:hypothetical protein